MPSFQSLKIKSLSWGSDLMKKFSAFLIVIAIAGIIISSQFPLEETVTNLKSQINGTEILTQVSVSKDNYWSNRLNESEQKAYKCILSSITDFPEQIPITKVEDGEMNDVFEALSYDNPDFFFLGYSSSVQKSGYNHYFIPEYIISKEEYNSYLNQVNAVVDELITQTQGMSEYEKELYVHDYLVSNCEYNDSAGALKTTIYGTLINKQANCEGYSRTTQYVLNKMGIKCRVIIGEANNADGKAEGHMWNVVSIEGKEYNLDVTWDDYKLNGVNEKDTAPSHMYMNVPTSEIELSHKSAYPQDNSQCVSNDLNYYLANGLYFAQYNNEVKNAIVKETINQVNNGKSSIEIKFTNQSAYDTAVQRLFDSQEIYRIIARANLQSYFKIKNEIYYVNTDDKYVIRIFYELR